MIVRKKIKEEIEKEVIEKATCSFCGKEFDKITTECEGFGSIIFNFGYGSSFDGDKFKLEICDDCFLKQYGGLLKEQLKEKGYSIKE